MVSRLQKKNKKLFLFIDGITLHIENPKESIKKLKKKKLLEQIKFREFAGYETNIKLYKNNFHL